MPKTVQFGGKVYTLTPLCCKELKEVSVIIGENNKGSSAVDFINQWTPILIASLKRYHPEITSLEIENATLAEFTSIKDEVLSLSGIKIIANDGSSKQSIDWGWIYGRLCSSFGWSYRLVDEHTLGEVEELMDYLGEYPPVVDILMAAYKVETRYRRKNKAKLTEEEFEQQFNQLPQLLGMPEKLPDDLMSGVRWAQEQMAKMGLNKKPN